MQLFAMTIFTTWVSCFVDLFHQILVFSQFCKTTWSTTVALISSVIVFLTSLPLPLPRRLLLPVQLHLFLLLLLLLLTHLLVLFILL
jgi:hypothetical protein